MKWRSHVFGISEEVLRGGKLRLALSKHALITLLTAEEVKISTPFAALGESIIHSFENWTAYTKFKNRFILGIKN